MAYFKRDPHVGYSIHVELYLVAGGLFLSQDLALTGNNTNRGSYSWGSEGKKRDNKIVLKILYISYICTEDFKEVIESTMTYRRERSIRDAYDERFLPERGYPRPAGPAERRGPYSRPEDGYGRGDYEYDGRFFPNGGGPQQQRTQQQQYHGEEQQQQQRAYHGNDNVHFPTERRTAPPSRPREEYPYRVPREEPHTGRPIDQFGARAPPPPSVRNQANLYPAARSLPEGDDTLMQAILNLDRGEDRDPYRRKTAPAPFPPIRERSPVRREVARSPHSRSGSSVSSRGYSPDRTKGLPFPSQQGKSADGPAEGLAAVPDHLWGALFSQKSGHDTLDKVPGLSPRDGSPQSTTSNKEEIHPLESEKEEPVAPPVPEESHQSRDDLQERRAKAITSKAQEIEKVYRQDCETFGMVVKMLVAKDPALEKQLQVPLRENLGEIRERCLEDLKHFISELDDAVAVRHPDPNV